MNDNSAAVEAVPDEVGGDQAQPASPIKILRAPEALEEQVRPLFADRSVRVIGARVVESLEQADIDVEQARREGERILDQARQQADELRERARQEGHAEGIEEVVELIARAKREYTELVDSAEEDMLELAFRLARRIVGQAIELDPARVEEMIATVLRHARGRRRICVAVCPQDLDVLEDSADRMSKLVDGVPVHFEADETLVRGSCVIQTESGRIDGRIQTQLETLMRALRANQD
ncbi:MAG: FliH/SctL family protein [Persicimonas sp.]